MGYTVLSVAYPLTPVGRDAVGGSEQVLSSLDKALTDSGHHSVVIAAAGSRVRGTLIASPPGNGTIRELDRHQARIAHQRLIHEALARYPVDLVHMHSLDFHHYLPENGPPVLATLHLPPDWYPDSIFRTARKHFYLNCVSSSQLRCCPSSAHMLPFVQNGVEIGNGPRRWPRAGYALGLGRICPEKGFHEALDAARLADADMLLAGEVAPFPDHRAYFRSQIVPRLDRRRRFVGVAGFQRKTRLLAQARCVLIASSVAETSSLVAMEALTLGTPVIAFPVGALPEIIEHTRTGFLVSSVGEMAEAIREVASIDPEMCRQAARTRFSARDMKRRYLEMYDSLIRKAVTEDGPRVRPGASWLVA